jgi:hypothetical protein
LERSSGGEPKVAQRILRGATRGVDSDDGAAPAHGPQPANAVSAKLRTHTFEVARLRDAVGMREISDRLGYPEASIRQWRKRGLLPEPTVMPPGVPVWEWDEVLRWAHGTGRDDRLTWLA